MQPNEEFDELFADDPNRPSFLLQMFLLCAVMLGSVGIGAFINLFVEKPGNW
jgi:hypothetical protein